MRGQHGIGDRVTMRDDSNDARRGNVDPSIDSIGSDLEQLPPSTLWHRRNGRQSKRQKAVKQQLLTPHQEQALVDYVLRMSRNGYPIPAKSLPFLARVILCSENAVTSDSIPLPSKK